jgi:hypothetical protein
MSKKPPPISPERQLQLEMSASETLRSQLRDIAGGESEFFHDLVEGETKIFEIMGKLVHSMADDQWQLLGLSEHIKALQARKASLDKRIETKKEMIGATLTAIKKTTHRFDICTFTVSDKPPGVIVTEESSIPSKFFKSQAPQLDKTELNKAVLGRFHGLEEANEIEDPDAKAAAIAKVNAEFPEIPGATITNGGVTVTVRV